MPRLIEDRCRQIFGRLETLVEFFRRKHLIQQRLRDGFAGLVMLGVIFQHLRPNRPHLVNLRWILDEIARNTRSAEARIFHIGKHSVQRVPEFMKRGPHFVVGQQGRLARGRLRNIQMIRHHRFGAEEVALLNVGVHPGAAAL